MVRGLGGGVAGVALACAVGAVPAEAVELHAGVMAHNIQITDGKNAGKEDGPNLELQATFGSPAFLSWAGGPRPYVVGSVNTTGATSFGGVGVEWHVPLGEAWSVQPGLGYVIHNGELNLPFPAGDPRNTRFNAENVLYGSRDLFRTTVGLSRNLGQASTIQVFYNHLSHGQILGTGRNQGVDQLGVRIGWKMGE